MPLLPASALSTAVVGLIFVGAAWIAVKRDVPKAYALAALNVLVVGLQAIAPAFGSQLTYDLGFQTDTFLAGKWWSPLTAMFAHADLFHIFGNMFILVTAGPALEERIGERKFLLVYFLAGLAGFAAHVILSFVVPNVVPTYTTALGASGAIFGVLTCYAVRYPRSLLPMIFPGFMLFVVRLPAFVYLLIYLGINVAYLGGALVGATGGGVAWWGHFAGFLVGLPFAYTLPKHHPTAFPVGSAGLPDAEKLAPLATTPKARRLLDQVRQFKPEARTQHDAEFAMAWVDRFLATVECPTCGAHFTRKGMLATCKSGETAIDFSRGRK